jgi:hypothetical protein
MLYNKSHLVNSEGNFVPLFVTDLKYVDIRTSDFDPCTNEIATNIPKYMNFGFLVRPDTDGSFYGITWTQYNENGKILDGLEPQLYMGTAKEWIECPFVKVFAKNDSSFGNVSSFINIGRI